MLTDDQLAEIRKRADAATPGPWEWWYDDDGVWAVSLGQERQCAEIFGPHVYVSLNGALQIYLGAESRTGCMAEGDEEFIAHARADVPALLDEIARLKAELTA